MSVLTPYDIERDRGGREHGMRWPLVLVGLFVAVLLVAAAGAVWVQRQINPPGEPGAEVEVVIEEGMSVDEIGRLLAEQGVIANATVFRYYARLNGADNIQAGRYTLNERESFGRVLDILAGGADVDQERLTVPEGLTVEKVADVVGQLPGRSAARFLELVRSGTVRSQYQPPGNNNLEGFLLPETYFFDEGADEEAILRRMVREFDDTATALGIATAAARLDVTPYELIVIASMVEREAKVPDERGQIARVIYNRIEQGMRLNIDATVIYALGGDKERLLFRDLEVDSPYNTYRVDGLPPGPIASPGRASLEAAVAPTPGPWLYYVLTDHDGRHAFATTGAEHERNVADSSRRGII
jgi:UPF0755 protein